MTSTIFSIDASPASPASVLVVEPSLGDVLSVVSTLSQLGFRVTVSDNFHDAKARLLTRPTLLVTELRLGEYNGLHLVLRGKATNPDMAAIVMSPVTDTVLLAEAERMGATFVVKSIAPDELRAAICRTVFKMASSSADPIRAPFERRRAKRRSHAHATGPDPDRRLAERRRDIATLTRHAPPG